MKTARCVRTMVFALSVGCAFATASFAQTVRNAQIVAVTPGGVGYVTTSSGTTGISAMVGRWDTPYPNADSGEPAPGLEPYGASTLTIDIDVNDGGLVSFSYKFLTYDAGIYDWFDAYIVTPTGTINLVSQFGKPGSDYGTYWESSQVVLTQSLDQWRNQRVSFVFSVVQDGWGDQSATRIDNFDIRTCQVPPLTQITDPAALGFEGGNTLDTADLIPAMQAALSCLRQAAAAARGALTVNSAYRPPAYQAHLREVWDRWNDLRNRRDPECVNLRTDVQQEFQRHGLLLTQRPAAASAHTRGEAFDANWTLPAGTNIDTLAANCGLQRPFATDPVHFIQR
jgi:hypothetical protein